MLLRQLAAVMRVEKEVSAGGGTVAQPKQCSQKQFWPRLAAPKRSEGGMDTDKKDILMRIARINAKAGDGVRSLKTDLF
jgi:hypothetical protein